MLDQNTDRMWYVIGAVIIGAAIILILNGTAPELFASVGEAFKGKTEKVTEMTDGIGPKMRVNDNLLLTSEVESGWLDDEGGVSSPRTDRDFKIGNWSSGYIAVEDADYMTFTTNGRHQTKRAVFYSEKDVPMGIRLLNTEPKDTVMVYDVPEGAKYIRVSSMNWGTDHFKVERGKYSTGEPPTPDDIYFGQNLLLNSESFTMDGVTDPGIIRSITNEGYLQLGVDVLDTHASISDFGLAASSDHINNILVEGDDYTFSVQVKSPDVTLAHANDHILFTIGDNVLLSGINGRIGSDWVTLYHTRTWTGEDFNPKLDFENIQGTFIFRNPKLEKGIAATAYSVAP